jgi:hypothetical protein
VLLHAGHLKGTRVVHLTHTTLVLEGLCGDAVDLHGEPDLAVICLECLELARAVGADLLLCVTEIEGEAPLLRLAA